MAPLFLDPGTSWWCVVKATPRPALHLAKRRGTHRIGGWVGPRAGLDASMK